jgi:hypothetical protein
MDLKRKSLFSLKKKIDYNLISNKNIRKGNKTIDYENKKIKSKK